MREKNEQEEIIKERVRSFQKWFDGWSKGMRKQRKWFWVALICLSVAMSLFLGVVTGLVLKRVFSTEMWLAISGILLALGGVALSLVWGKIAILGMTLSLGCARYQEEIKDSRFTLKIFGE